MTSVKARFLTIATVTLVAMEAIGANLLDGSKSEILSRVSGNSSQVTTSSNEDNVSSNSAITSNDVGGTENNTQSTGSNAQSSATGDLSQSTRQTEKNTGDDVLVSVEMYGVVNPSALVVASIVDGQGERRFATVEALAAELVSSSDQSLPTLQPTQATPNETPTMIPSTVTPTIQATRTVQPTERPTAQSTATSSVPTTIAGHMTALAQDYATVISAGVVSATIQTATAQPTPSRTLTTEYTPTATGTPQPTNTPTVRQQTPTATSTPTEQATNTPVPSDTPTVRQQTATPTNTPTAEQVATATNTATSQPTNTNTPVLPTVTPTATADLCATPESNPTWTFDNGLQCWTVTGDAAVSEGKLTLSNGKASRTFLAANGIMKSLSFDAKVNTLDVIISVSDAGSGILLTSGIVTGGLQTILFTPISNVSLIQILAGGETRSMAIASVSIDNVSVVDTLIPTPTPTQVISATATPSATSTITNATSTVTPTNTGVQLPSPTPTFTALATETSTVSPPTPTDTATLPALATATPTPTATVTEVPSVTPTFTRQLLPTAIPTDTATVVDTPVPTATNTVATVTPQPTDTATVQAASATDTPVVVLPTATFTLVELPTVTPTPTLAELPTVTPTPTYTPVNCPGTTIPMALCTTITPWTDTPTVTPTNTDTETTTSTPTATDTDTPTSTPTWTDTETPTETFTPTSTDTATATETSTDTPTDTATPTFTESPTATSTDTATETSTPTWTETETPTETPTETFTPTFTDTPTPTDTETSTPTDTATDTPTATATSTFTPTPTNTPCPASFATIVGTVSSPCLHLDTEESIRFTFNNFCYGGRTDVTFNWYPSLQKLEIANDLSSPGWNFAMSSQNSFVGLTYVSCSSYFNISVLPSGVTSDYAGVSFAVVGGVMPTRTPTPLPTDTATSTPTPTFTATATPTLCVISGQQAGKMHHIRWQYGAGVDNINADFAGADVYGLPFRTVSAPVTDTYIAGSAYTYNYAPLASISELWAVVPAGVVSVTLGSSLAGGNAANGVYVGSLPSTSVRGPNWGTGGTSQTVLDITNYPQVCGQRIVYMRGYTSDSYFQGGIQLAWNIGSGWVAIPSANIYGVNPLGVAPTPIPTITLTPTPTPTNTRTPTPTDTPTDTATPTPTATVTPTPTPTMISCYSTSSGQVSCWNGNGDTADSWWTNVGILTNGATFATGRIGQAFSLDGVNDYVSVPDANSLDLATDFTIAVWVYQPAIQGGYHIVVGKGRGPSSTGIALGFSNSIPGIALQVGSTPCSTADTATLPVGQWNHVAATFTGSTLRLYINGTFVTSQVCPYASAQVSSEPLLIGAETVGLTGRNFAGLADDVMVFNRALSLAEVQAIYYGLPAPTDTPTITPTPTDTATPTITPTPTATPCTPETNLTWTFDTSAVCWSFTGKAEHSGNSLYFNGGLATGNGVASREFVTVPGQSYTIQFTQAMAGGGGTLQARLDINDTSGASLHVSTNGLGSVTKTFTAVGSVSILKFTDLSVGAASSDLMIDNITIN